MSTFSWFGYLDISHTSPRAMRPAVNQSRITTFPFEDSSTSWKEYFTGSQETMLTIDRVTYLMDWNMVEMTRSSFHKFSDTVFAWQHDSLSSAHTAGLVLLIQIMHNKIKHFLNWWITSWHLLCLLPYFINLPLTKLVKHKLTNYISAVQ